MKTGRETMSLAAYTAVHFMVDFACFYYLMGTFSLYEFTGIGIAKGFLLYNVIAFGLQFLIGWYYDGRNYVHAGIVGLLLIMAGIGMETVLPMLCKDALVIEMEVIAGIPYKDWLTIMLIVLALGNAFFHVAGGMDSLLYSKGKMSRCGIFVSSGALGVAIGSYIGKNALLDGISLLCVLLVGTGLLIVYGKPEKEQRWQNHEQKKEDPKMLLPALLCFGAIMLRGYLGTLLTTSFSVLFLAAIATCFGKLMGGILADAFGGKRIGIVSMAVAAICFSGVFTGPLVSIVGIVSFNLTMPITYYTLYESFPHHPGFACGLNCLGLVLGVSIACFVQISSGIIQWIIILGMLLAAVLIFCSAPVTGKEVEA